MSIESSYITREEYERRHRELLEDIEKFKGDVLGRMDKQIDASQKDHDLFIEWKGRTELALYIIPVLTGFIGFLLGVHF